MLQKLRKNQNCKQKDTILSQYESGVKVLFFFILFLLTFLVGGFFNEIQANSVVSSVEILEVTEPACSDGVCNGSETCSSCSVDCGSCPSSGGGGTHFNPPALPSPTPENPQGGFKILINNDNKYANNQLVALKLFGGPDAVKMAISNSPDFKDSGQEPYLTTKSWNLCSSAGGASVSSDCLSGKYTVYVKFYNKLGQSSDIVSDSIIFNTPSSCDFEPEKQRTDPNSDCSIDILDFNILMMHWGSSEEGNTADFNADGVFDIYDFNLLMVYWST